jgi:hypothetical protein
MTRSTAALLYARRAKEAAMAVVMVAVGAAGLTGWLVAVLLLRRRPQRSSANADAVPISPSRDEDRVRPAVTATGERIWVESPDELVWHEIVAWPQLKKNLKTEARRPA